MIIESTILQTNRIQASLERTNSIETSIVVTDVIKSFMREIEFNDIIRQILLESGDLLLMENGDTFILEA